ncbi:hypothetical protein SteCoe_24490 [Stentor coeruleus]|uniref:Uncharacterized protein n=1 Tax=Stentor coeruleus TaxID=5963 RepID=A0A1R2BHS8_9CILI|nr:hypothetical protein SteCoe_24490 [Stentor coeruleus]
MFTSPKYAKQPRKSFKILSPSLKNTISDCALVRSFELFSPKNRVDKKALQDLASERLSRGATTRNVRVPLYEEIFAGSKARDYELNLTQEEDNEITELIENLSVLKDIKAELQLNYSICKKEELYNQVNLNGLFFVLKDKLKAYSIDARMDFNWLSQELVSLNPYIRELIRAQKSRGLEQGADLLELFWRVLVKLLDNACYSHFLMSKILADKVQTESRAVFTDKQKEITKLKEQYESHINKISTENNTLKEKLSGVKNDYETIKHELIKKTNYIKELFKYDNRDKDMENLKKLLGGVDKFIVDTEREQARQMMALQTVAKFIDAAKEAYVQPKYGSVSTQTDPFSIDVINCNSKYEDYLSTFGTTFGEIGSCESINAFVSLIKRDLEPKSSKRTAMKRKTKL